MLFGDSSAAMILNEAFSKGKPQPSNSLYFILMDGLLLLLFIIGAIFQIPGTTCCLLSTSDE
jgi:hypothetical protein